MGCDIHIFVEGLLPSGDWVLLEHIPDAQRRYKWFGRLAGVRSDVVPLVPPRGLPVDTSPGTIIWRDLWAEDAHTYSWLTLGEWVLIEREFDLAYVRWSPVMSVLDEWVVEDLRVIFWFDN